jgi:hypothetical protein
MGNTISCCFGKQQKTKEKKLNKSRGMSKLSELEIVMFADPPKKSTYMGLPLAEPCQSDENESIDPQVETDGTGDRNVRRFCEGKPIRGEPTQDVSDFCTWFVVLPFRNL